MAQPQPARYGNYLLLEKMFAGSITELYKARVTDRQGSEELVVVKKLLPYLARDQQLVTSFVDEARLATRLDHQNVARTRDFGRMDDSYYLAMEYLSGKDLRAVIDRGREKGRPLDIACAFYIVAGVCSGLDYGHRFQHPDGKRADIVHGGISPRHVFVTYDGAVKILELGMAMAVFGNPATQYGALKKQLVHMSPEQASGVPIDRRTDVFSTGALLYEMVTGRQMFRGDSTMEILAAVRDGVFAPAGSIVDGLPDRALAVLDRALAKDPEKRYQSCAEMQSDVEACMRELSFEARPADLARYLTQLFDDQPASGGGGEGLPATGIDGPEKRDKDATPSAAVPQATVGAAPRGSGRRRVTLYVASAAAVVIVAGLVAFAVQRGQAPAVHKEPASVADQASPPPQTTEPAAKRAADETRGAVNALLVQAGGVMETDPEKARGLLLDALRMDPASAVTYLQLGRANVKLKDYARAAEAYRKATQLEPQSADAYFNLGYAYAMNKEYMRAEEMYMKVVQLNPPYLDEALFNLAVVQEKLGKKKESTANLEQALSVNPKNELARNYADRTKGRPGKQR